MSKRYYLIITEPVNVKVILTNAKTIGDVRTLFTTTFVLSMTEEKELSDIRAVISGERHLSCLVISLDAYITSAWSMSKESSDYFKSVFSDIYGEEETPE